MRLFVGFEIQFLKNFMTYYTRFNFEISKQCVLKSQWWLAKYKIFKNVHDCRWYFWYEMEFVICFLFCLYSFYRCLQKFVRIWLVSIYTTSSINWNLIGWLYLCRDVVTLSSGCTQTHTLWLRILYGHSFFDAKRGKKGVFSKSKIMGCFVNKQTLLLIQPVIWQVFLFNPKQILHEKS